MEPYFANFLSDGWELGDRYHRMGLLPPLADRRSLDTGRRVKLEFQIMVPVDREGRHLYAAFEWMWVEIEERRRGCYRGVLTNLCLHDPETLQPGTPVWFKPQHVVDILEPAAG